MFKVVLTAVLLGLIMAARPPFITDVLAGEEGEFAALVLNCSDHEAGIGLKS